MTNSRIVTMQQCAIIQTPFNEEGMSVEEFSEWAVKVNADERERANGELAQVQADGYEIVPVAIGGNDRCY